MKYSSRHLTLIALTMLDQGVGIHVYYQYYQAVLAAQAKFTKLHRAGKWDAPFVSTQNDFIALVISRTMQYNEYKKNLEQAEHYSEMEEWLQESSRALTNIEIQGFEQKVYQWSHLQGYFAQDGKPWEESEDESKVKEQKVKKTHKKSKQEKRNDKGKAKAKEISSDEESESSRGAPFCKKSDSSCRKQVFFLLGIFLVPNICCVSQNFVLVVFYRCLQFFYQ